MIALSAPIFIRVDGQSFWKPSAIPSIVARLKLQMQDVLELDPQGWEIEWEESEPFRTYWQAQRGALETRIRQANAIYDDIEKRAAAAISP